MILSSWDSLVRALGMVLVQRRNVLVGWLRSGFGELLSMVWCYGKLCQVVYTLVHIMTQK